MDQNSFSQADLGMFTRHKITLEYVASAELKRVTDEEARCHGIDYSGDMAGLLIPYLDPNTGRPWTYRVRRDHPETEDGKPRRKYMTAVGDRKRFYFPPGSGELLPDCEVTAVIVESEKSVLSGMCWAQRANRRVLFIGMGGCWGWRGRTGIATEANGKCVDEKGPLTDFNLISWKDRDVVILFDNNVATNFKVRLARLALAQELLRRGAKVRLGDLPTVDNVNGPDDLLAEVGDWAIASLLETAGTFPDVSLAEAEAIVVELASSEEARERGDLKHIFAALAAVDDQEARERLIGRAAKAFGRLLPKSTLRDAVEGLRHERNRAAEDFAEQARKAALKKLKIIGSELVAELETFFAERVYLPVGAALILAYWVLNTWTYLCFETVPFLLLESVVSGCGKTTLLERLLAAVCARAEMTSNMTEGAMFRIIDKRQPTLLVDEAEILEGNSERAQSLRAIAQAGYKKGGRVARCVGDEHDVQWFNVYCPQAYAAIGGLSGALLDRCIVVHMERAPKDHHRKSTKIKAVSKVAEPLRQKLEAYSIQISERLTELYDNAPDDGYWPHIRNREAELFEPLLVHARLAGSTEEARLLNMIEKFSRQKATIVEDDWRVAQIFAMLEAVTAQTGDRFTPADLVDSLEKTEAWAKTFSKYKAGDDGKKPKAASIGRLLKTFRMESRLPTKSGISYRRDEAIAKLSAHLPPQSLTSLTHSSPDTSIHEVIETTNVSGLSESQESGERDSNDGVKDYEKPNGKAGGFLEFEL